MSGVRMHFCTLVARGHGGVLLARHVRDERHHAGDGEQQRGVRRDERGGGHHGVTVGLEVVEPTLANVRGLHLSLTSINDNAAGPRLMPRSGGV